MERNRALRSTLTANAAFSAVGGVLATVAPEAVDRLLGTGHGGWVQLAGAGLFAFAAGVLVVARAAEQVVVTGATVISAADASWVIASIAAVAAGWFSFSGVLTIAVVAVVVAGFGLRQFTLVRGLHVAPVSA